MKMCWNTGSTATALGPTSLSSVGAPADQLLTLFRDDAGEQGLNRLAGGGVGRQEDQADTVLAVWRQRGGGDLAEEFVWCLDQDAGAVAGVDLAAAGAAVTEVDQHLQRLLHDGVRLPPLDVDHEADTAGVVLVLGVVQPLLIVHGVSSGRLFRGRCAGGGTCLSSIRDAEVKYNH
jgi:hypothetical protein